MMPGPLQPGATGFAAPARVERPGGAAPRTPRDTCKVKGSGAVRPRREMAPRVARRRGGGWKQATGNRT
jgi:hypothetical protein